MLKKKKRSTYEPDRTVKVRTQNESVQSRLIFDETNFENSYPSILRTVRTNSRPKPVLTVKQY